MIETVEDILQEQIPINETIPVETGVTDVPADEIEEMDPSYIDVFQPEPKLKLYEVLPADFEGILFMYIVFIGAAILLFPITRFILNTLTKGVITWQTKN